MAERTETVGAPAPGDQEQARTPGAVASANRPLRLGIVAGEHSGDLLGGKLMAELNRRLPGVTYAGVGGETMEAEGLQSTFPMGHVAVMGPLAILSQLPRLVRRVYQAVDAIVAFEPDALIIIDSPEFSHPIAKRVRKRFPGLPVIDYVSPSVWAWRPGRAKKMTPYVDHVLALLPFEPDAHARLGGPACTYVGHPMIERLDEIRSTGGPALRDRLGIPAEDHVLVVLPGSRASEVRRLGPIFKATLEALPADVRPPHILVPTVASVAALVREQVTTWPGTVHVVEGTADKFASFATCRAALAASGTVTLELGLAGTPMVVGYKLDVIAGQLKFLIAAPSVILANLVLGENVFPEFIQEDCAPEKLAPALADVLSDGPFRTAQCEGLARIADRMQLEGGRQPSEAAADVIVALLREHGLPA